MSAICLKIAEASQLADARRRSRSLAVENGFDETAAEKVAIVATEAVTNLLKHAGGGELLLAASRISGEWYIDLLALDRGPGMNPAACRVDGFSTTGTRGTGIGAMGRMSAFFDIYSQPGSGTAVFARISKNGPPPAASLRIHGVQLPKPGEDVCGDQWGIVNRRRGAVVVLADGLGHGTDACVASRAAVDAVKKNQDLSPQQLVTRIHESIRHTRGAAVSVVEFDEERQVVHFCGLGNISGRILEGGSPSRHMVSLNGTAGVESRERREFSYPWPTGSAVVLHSDGLSARWDLSDYPGLLVHDPGVMAGVLMRDQWRHSDDATVVVCK